MTSNELRGLNRIRQEENTQRKAVADTNYFWSLVEKNRGRQQPRLKSSHHSEQQEKQLFGASSGENPVSHNIVDENIPVERSGILILLLTRLI